MMHDIESDPHPQARHRLPPLRRVHVHDCRRAVLARCASSPRPTDPRIADGRNGAFLAGFLGVLFLATGGAAAANAADFWVQCNAWTPALARTVCNETSAAAAFGFLGWVAGA